MVLTSKELLSNVRERIPVTLHLHLHLHLHLQHQEHGSVGRHLEQWFAKGGTV